MFSVVFVIYCVSSLLECKLMKEGITSALLSNRHHTSERVSTMQIHLMKKSMNEWRMNKYLLKK